MGIWRINRVQRVFTGLFLLASTGYLFFNTTRILQQGGGERTDGEFWGESSLLYNTKYQQKSWNLNEFIFGKANKRNAAAYNQFMAIQSQYEAQRNYGMVDAITEQTYYLQMTGLTQKTFELIQRSQAEAIRDSLGLAAAEQYLTNPQYSFLKTPAAIVGTLAAFYTGRVMRYKIDDEWRLNVQGKGTHVALLSVAREGFSGAFAKDDSIGRYRLLVSQRLLGKVALSTGYVPGTQTTSIGVSQALAEGWTVGYDRTFTGADRNQDNLRVNFSQGF